MSPRMMIGAVGVAACACLLAAACHKDAVTPPGVVCATYAAAGLNVTVTDSVTGAALVGANVVAIGRNGAPSDSAKTGSGAGISGMAALLWERPGSFDVTVTMAGYAPWSRVGVAIAKDVCHVIPVALSARLVKL